MNSLVADRYSAPLVKVVGTAVKSDGEHMQNAIWACMTMELAGSERMVSYLKQIVERKLDTLYVTSNNDRLVDRKIFEEMSKLLQIVPSDVVKFDAKGQQTTNQNMQVAQPNWIRSVQFEAGGHYAFIKQSQEVNEAIYSLMQRVIKNDDVIEKRIDEYAHSSVNQSKTKSSEVLVN